MTFLPWLVVLLAWTGLLAQAAAFSLCPGAKSTTRGMQPAQLCVTGFHAVGLLPVMGQLLRWKGFSLMMVAGKASDEKRRSGAARTPPPLTTQVNEGDEAFEEWMDSVAANTISREVRRHWSRTMWR